MSKPCPPVRRGCAALGGRLGLPLAADDEAEFAVQVGEQGLQVLQLGADSPVRCGSISSRAPAPTGASSAAAADR